MLSLVTNVDLPFLIEDLLHVALYVVVQLEHASLVENLLVFRFFLEMSNVDFGGVGHAVVLLGPCKNFFHIYTGCSALLLFKLLARFHLLFLDFETPLLFFVTLHTPAISQKNYVPYPPDLLEVQSKL